MTRSDSLRELQSLVADFIRRRDWNKYHTVMFYSTPGNLSKILTLGRPILTEHSRQKESKIVTANVSPCLAN